MKAASLGADGLFVRAVSTQPTANARPARLGAAATHARRAARASAATAAAAGAALDGDRDHDQRQPDGAERVRVATSVTAATRSMAASRRRVVVHRRRRPDPAAAAHRARPAAMFDAVGRCDRGASRSSSGSRPGAGASRGQPVRAQAGSPDAASTNSRRAQDAPSTTRIAQRPAAPWKGAAAVADDGVEDRVVASRGAGDRDQVAAGVSRRRCSCRGRCSESRSQAGPRAATTSRGTGIRSAAAELRVGDRRGSSPSGRRRPSSARWTWSNSSMPVAGRQVVSDPGRAGTSRKPGGDEQDRARAGSRTPSHDRLVLVAEGHFPSELGELALQAVHPLERGERGEQEGHHEDVEHQVGAALDPDERRPPTRWCPATATAITPRHDDADAGHPAQGLLGARSDAHG